MSKEIELSTKNFKEASKINGNDEFCFIIGDSRIYCHSFIAAFLSRKILRNLISDPTLSTFEIKPSKSNSNNTHIKEESEFLQNLIDGVCIKIDEKQIKEMKDELEQLSTQSKEYANTLIYSYLFIIERLENEELREKFFSIIFSDDNKEIFNNKEKQKTKEEIKKEIKYLQQVDILFKLLGMIDQETNQNIFNQEQIKFIYNKYFQSEYISIIDDISSNFYEIDEEIIIKMNSVILKDVLNSSKLKIETEENLLHALLHRRAFYLQKQDEIKIEDEDFFIDNVRFEYLNSDAISEFVKEISFDSMNENIWSSVCRRLVLPVENEKKNERVRKQAEKKVKFEYKNDEKFNGIMKHLSDVTNGNIQTNQTIEIKCSKLCCGNLTSLVDYTQSEGAAHVYGNPTPRWLQFDFKTRKVQINAYLIKTSNNDSRHIRSWNLEISTDGIQWNKIDERNEVTELNGQNHVKSFNIEMTKPFRYIRFITTKPNFCNDDGFSLGKLEFYGNVISEQ